MNDPKHVLSFAYERLGDENVVAIRCTEHPDFLASRYTWPSRADLLVIGKEHDPEYPWREVYT